MSDSSNDNGTGCGLIVLAWVLATALFIGEPDLVDAIIYRLYDGNVPAVEEPNE